MKKPFLFFVLTILFTACQKNIKDANAIINKSIEISGGVLIKKANIEFDFRNKHYKAMRNNGQFQFERIFKDSLVEIRDVLNNMGFQRYINGEAFEVSDGKAQAYTASVNSVHYFSVLPYGLNDKAVNKTYLDDVEVKGQRYYKIKVTFNEQGGGEDFEDIFIYWVNSNTFKVDYLAYSYAEANGTGWRFREAYNERYVNGIRFVDYNNYKPKSNDITLENLDSLFEENQLELLSKIELKNIIVSIETTR